MLPSNTFALNGDRPANDGKKLLTGDFLGLACASSRLG